MKWYALDFQMVVGKRVKTHVVSEALEGAIAADLQSRGHPLMARAQIQPGEGWHNPAFDLGGSFVTGQPFDIFDVEGLSFVVGCSDIHDLRFALANSRKRESLGQSYHKIHCAYRCFVFTPVQHRRLFERVEIMRDLIHSKWMAHVKTEGTT